MAFDSPILAVVTPAVSRDLVTLHSAASECGAAIGDIPDLGLLVAAATDAVTAFTGRIWARETVRETFRGSGRGVGALLLSRAPVASVVSVSVDGTALNVATETECHTDAALLYRLDLDSRVEWGGRVVVVEYAGGYVVPGASGADMPAIVQRAAAKIVAGWYHGQGRDPRLRSQTTEDVGGKSWIDPTADDLGLPPGIGNLLSPYRRRRS